MIKSTNGVAALAQRDGDPVSPMTNAQNLFVYGLLRPSSGHGVAENLMDQAHYVGPARFQGRLFEIDGYPGVIDSETASECVLGDVFEIPNDPQFLAALDEFEGCGVKDPEPWEYRRVIRRVSAHRASLECWIYLYNWSLDGKRIIRGGDYLASVSVTERQQVIR